MPGCRHEDAIDKKAGSALRAAPHFMRRTLQGCLPPAAAKGVSTKRCARSRTVTLYASLSADADTLASTASRAPLVHRRSLRATRRRWRRSVPSGRSGWEIPPSKPRWASLFECCPARFHKVFSLIAHRSTRTIYDGAMMILLLGLVVVLIAARQHIQRSVPSTT